MYLHRQAGQWDMDAWYTHPVYARYWQHYQQAMSWYQRHRRAYSKALQAAYGPVPHPVLRSGVRRYSDWHSEQDLGRDYKKRRPNRREEGKDDESESEEESEGSDESELEYDVNNMDITTELRQYFAQTERHREEISEDNTKYI